jgi:3'(2'), 5'-bisphosphate nucleotidase
LTRSITKDDHSPVTVADFAAQALICHLLGQTTPDIPIVAEETSAVLRNADHPSAAAQIHTILKQEGYASDFPDLESLYASIDLGGKEPAKRFWTLDPIDGTKGFLRGEQFAIALALIEDGRVRLAVIGCPRLMIEEDPSHCGYLFSAVSDGPSLIRNLQTRTSREVSVSSEAKTTAMRFVQSYESAHGNLPLQHRIAQDLGLSTRPVQIDSQVKYSIVASGMAEVYVRIPNPQKPDYREKIWDHAAGSLLVEQAGGIVTDINGNPLDFGCGKTLERNRGIIAAVPQIHPQIVSLVRSYSEIRSASL